MSIPVASLVLCALMLVFAIRSNDGLVADDYYKQGLGINEQLGKEQAARKLGLEAIASISPDRDAIRIVLPKSEALKLKLRIVHPTRAGEDRSIDLIARGSGVYEAALPPLASGRWYAMLEDEDGSWRLNGEWNTAQPSFALRPTKN